MGEMITGKIIFPVYENITKIMGGKLISIIKNRDKGEAFYGEKIYNMSLMFSMLSG